MFCIYTSLLHVCHQDSHCQAAGHADIPDALHAADEVIKWCCYAGPGVNVTKRRGARRHDKPVDVAAEP